MNENEYERLSHSVWDCKFYIVFIPKYRQKKLYGELKKDLREQFHKLSFQKECRIVEGYLMKDHVHKDMEGEGSIGDITFGREDILSRQ